jgi:NAD(P)-dependent dehydrogenase (short-subunit alcohol dehydrogenase family)
MDVRLDGKVALITGADSGIGQGIALEFARSGADVAVHYYSDQAGAEATAAEVRAMGGGPWWCRPTSGTTRPSSGCSRHSMPSSARSISW